MKILIDMNLSPGWVESLTRSGFQAVHGSFVGKANATDAEIMFYAVKENFVVLTHDLDFGAILATTQEMAPSVTQIRAEDVRPADIGQFVANAVKQMESELNTGALLTIDPVRVRIRLLPFTHFN